MVDHWNDDLKPFVWTKTANDVITEVPRGRAALDRQTNPRRTTSLRRMRVFVLCTGRSGSMTFIRACEHADNVTAGHETRLRRLVDRFDYPDDHIEADNRLTWMLGPLAQAFPEARYVHLVRDHDAVAQSFAARYAAQRGAAWRVRRAARALYGTGGQAIPLAETFVHGLHGVSTVVSTPQRVAVFRKMVETMTANIEEFLVGRPHLRVDIDHGAERIGEVWNWLGVTGNLSAARAEFDVRHNARPVARMTGSSDGLR